MCYGMPFGTSQAEVMSNSEKIKPVAFDVIKLHLSEGISQLLSLGDYILDIKYY